MKRKNLGKMQCPVARTLERVGEWWSILILRDALNGLSRFDEFQKSLEIAPNILSRRLAALVDAGLLERRRYSERPPRDEYRLTASGRDFHSVLIALMAYGNKHFAPEGPSVLLVDAETGRKADPIVVDRKTGRPLGRRDVALAPGPAANARTKRQIAAVSWGRAEARERTSRRRSSASSADSDR